MAGEVRKLRDRPNRAAEAPSLDKAIEADAMSKDAGPQLFMVFDVESVGLHGEGFAVGYVVIERDKEVESGYFHCWPDAARGDADGRAWIAENVVPILEGSGLAQTYSDGLRSPDPKQVRNAFWAAWRGWKAKGAILAADCPWPVEARFLIACVEDDPAPRNWSGPYPLIDVASVRLAAGLDPLGAEERLDREKPIHHPLADARQSARLLIEALNVLQS